MDTVHQIRNCAHQALGLLSFFYSGTVSPESVEFLIIPTLKSIHRELLEIAISNYPVDLTDPYLKHHARTYLHPIHGPDSIQKVASYLNLLPPGEQTVSPEIAHLVAEILSLVQSDPS